MRLHFLCVLLGLTAAVADQPAAPSPPPAVRLPVAPVPSVEPSKVPPAPVSRLSVDEFYVIDSDIDLMVFASPLGVVKLTEEAGPLRFKGRFVGTGGKLETREFKGKEVWTVEPVVTGKVELLIIPVGAKAVLPDDVIRVTLDVDAGDGPRPPPPDVPVVDPKKPDPPVVPAGPTAKHLVVVVVEETADRTGGWPGKVLLDKGYRDWLKAGGHELELVEKSDPRAKSAGYLPYADRAGYPAVLLFDADKTGVQLPLREFKLPGTAEEWKVETGKAVTK